ncbi:hypothetical protein L249_1465 [Ophiocordyceps polyrhachis-furcata BCC 54312]|uniref:Uncharacterized protein n=1 Tax=Ophiocordyceps polyrhachis-furcata BCC 54312 TaxID=1330021 RepID=A0A367L437_9HYPO|nr:hypothetical protein L249_1465 [Ophiocordyceps polyrhachis-furcata BCC 54312]
MQSPRPNDDGFMPVSTWRGYIMVSTDLLPESVKETRRIYPDPQSEPDPSPEDQVRGLARTDTMMPPPLPRQRAVSSASVFGYDLSNSCQPTSKSPLASHGIPSSAASSYSPASDESAYQSPAEKFHQPLRPSPPPSWLWPDGSWLSDFAIDLPAGPSFPSGSQFWAMPTSPYLPQHDFLPAQAHEAAYAWASLPPQAHGYRPDVGAVGSSMTF